MYKYELVRLNDDVDFEVVNCSESQCYQLERELQNLIKEYEIDSEGSCYTDITEYTMFRNGCVEIVDGGLDCYIMCDFAISRVILTTKNSILLECYPINNNTWEPDYDSHCFYMVLR